MADTFFLNPVSVAVEECSQKGCLALSLLELMGFNLTFVFFASLLVLIEVSHCGGCLLAYEVWDSGAHFSPSPFPKCQETELNILEQIPGVPIVAHQLMNLLASMRMQVQSLVSVSGLRLQGCHELWYR